jgi:alpha-amylase/alpha-mannosidase (GH57 family)
MADIVSRHFGVRLTINFSPNLLLQIEDFVERGVTDEAWELSRTDAERVDGSQRDAILSAFFDADWTTRSFPTPGIARYSNSGRTGARFSAQDRGDRRRRRAGKRAASCDSRFPGGDPSIDRWHPPVTS